jgi:hypothetical protein
MSVDLAVLDPGAFLSLSTAGLLVEVGNGCGMRFLVAQTRTSDDQSREAVQDSAVCEHCLLSNEDETEWLLEYATAATEDEAAAAALSQCRKLPLVSDELKLRRLFSAHTNGAGGLLSIAQLLERWETLCPKMGSSITSAITMLQSGAHYSPSRSIPGFEWWKTRSARSEPSVSK